MAQISSYPSLTPQLGDKLLGSNTVDASGSPVTGNPTAQFTLTSVKTLIAQQFIAQFTASSAAVSQGPAATNTIHQIEFGPANTSSTNVTIDVNGKVIFLTTGTYHITQEYYLGGTSPNALFTLFRTYQDGTTQVGGGTQVEKFVVQDTADRKRIVIEQIIDITLGGTYYVFQMIRDSGGANDGGLYQILNNNVGWTTTPSAQLTISKLI